MFVVLKRKNIIFITSALLLGIGCYLGFNMVGTDTVNNISEVVENTDNNADELAPGDSIAVTATENYFLKSKNDKELIRSKATELLRSVIDDESSSSDARLKAENSIISIANDMDKETKIESLLSAKGFNDNVVFISEGLTTVTLRADKLSQEEVAKINDIVSEITGNNNIKIVEVN
ncbi:MAG: SpoIIIAH-like family protein [Clostridia bacterium]|nr:SpoIIIAH-like family protein [Clostridia bacterium]